jgi:hypothetical protein
MAELFFFAIFHKTAPRVSVFKNENDLPANLKVLAREVAIAVEHTHSLIRALVLFPADIELTGHPRSQAIAILHSPSLASPLDIMLMMIGKELLFDIEYKPLQPIHAIGAPFRLYKNKQFNARNSRTQIPSLRYFSSR